jgi:hypothetical protein
VVSGHPVEAAVASTVVPTAASSLDDEHPTSVTPRTTDATTARTDLAVFLWFNMARIVQGQGERRPILRRVTAEQSANFGVP